MKKKALSCALALILGLSGPLVAFASPCDSLVCMTGKAMGQSGGDNCNKPISDFLSIKKFHHGHLDLSATSDARRQFLNECPDANQSNAGNVDQVISLFGAME
ncbi:IncN plasmid KikA protein [Burkholderia sp. Bp9143]|uniref:TrbM/KikA/MpfK family conjugal transfer protein n=1 Tax=Burkholderia sp. Bp9143 TaxID=2184574 RepID=UPI000F5A2B72|nr:TrbM/KikA/MpfK family conjugal transfer protein [Burkholderia sp. Bp9143]RQR22928.1 IncN plasmid KikA protein [Burkholderia sp. Bp9143]